MEKEKESNKREESSVTCSCLNKEGKSLKGFANSNGKVVVEPYN